MATLHRSYMNRLHALSMQRGEVNREQDRSQKKDPRRGEGLSLYTVIIDLNTVESDQNRPLGSSRRRALTQLLELHRTLRTLRWNVQIEQSR